MEKNIFFLRRLFSPAPARSAFAPRSRRGVTLVELMVALSILTIGIVGLMSTFGLIQKGVQSAKNRTLASNLGQELMQILKQKTYYQVLVTTNPAINTTDFAPEVMVYDQGFFPPEEITEAGVVYTRYVHVQSIREDSGVIVDVAPNTPDLGMKRITVNVVWGYGNGKRKVTMRSILANPDTVMANAVFNGIVKTTAPMTTPIPGAMVGLVESEGCADTANASGQYSFTTTPAFYTLRASATGYYPVLLGRTIAAGVTQTNDFTLTRIAVGTMRGYPWLTDHLVISQIVGSTCTADPCSSGYDQEYVEIFNPTTYTWLVNGDIALKFRHPTDSAKTIAIEYRTEEISSGGYYLFASTGVLFVAGSSVEADAVWDAGNNAVDFPHFATDRNIIPVVGDGGADDGSGSLEMAQISRARVLDKVGWDKTGYPAPVNSYEGTAIVQFTGLTRNELYARRTSTGDTAGVDWTRGPAYDSNNNNLDFYDYTSPVSTAPRNSSLSGVPVVAGTPAIGAVISCSDGNSASAEAVFSSNTATPQPYAYFSLVNVATGAWSITITSGAYSVEQATVSVLNPGFVYTFASSSTFLTQEIDTGIITGRVRSTTGAMLNGVTITSDGAVPARTGSDGFYRIRTATGPVDIMINPPGYLSSYVTISSHAIPVEAGGVHSGVDVVLYAGGRVSGFVTRDGVNGLPGVAVSILNYNGVASDQQVSGLNGHFTSVILSTGFYTAVPSIGSLEASYPLSSTVTIRAIDMGQAVFSASFTITGALGYVSGTVQSGGKPISTGVLIVVTTAPLPSVLSGTPPVSMPEPPILSSTSLTAPPVYIISSMENGVYRAEVRQSTNPAYGVYAYYPTPSGTAASIVYSSCSNVQVRAGSITWVNFSW